MDTKELTHPITEVRSLFALIHDADSAVRGAKNFINMSGQKNLNEIENAVAWLNTATENHIKALATLDRFIAGQQDAPEPPK